MCCVISSFSFWNNKLLMQDGPDLVEKRFDLRLEDDLEKYWNRLDYICMVA